jgi:hypothetical protein
MNREYVMTLTPRTECVCSLRAHRLVWDTIERILRAVLTFAAVSVNTSRMPSGVTAGVLDPGTRGQPRDVTVTSGLREEIHAARPHRAEELAIRRPDGRCRPPGRGRARDRLADQIIASDDAIDRFGSLVMAPTDVATHDGTAFSGCPRRQCRWLQFERLGQPAICSATFQII